MKTIHKGSRRIRGTTQEIEAAAVDLRREMTPAEQRLWTALRNRQLNGLKFRVQHAIGPFILDFCCPSCRLVIEVDGDIHDLQQERDQARTEQLISYGYRVIRFRNEEIMNDLRPVLARIQQAITEE